MQLTEAFAPIDETSRPNSDRDDPWRPILPVPADAPPLTRAMLSAFAPAGFSLAAGWRYRDAEAVSLDASFDTTREFFKFCQCPMGANREIRTRKSDR